MSDARKAALVDLLGLLRSQNYRFVTPTPLTHARVVARLDKQSAKDLRDVFGWNVPFARDVLSSDGIELLRAADALEERDGQMRSKLRVASLGDDLFLHSSFPTTQSDAVFFGPDSYRFARFVAAELPRFGPRQRLVDMGCGSGVGAVAALRVTRVARVALADINPNALALADVNLACALGASEPSTIDILNASTPEAIDGAIDCVIANPPYIADPAHRLYRDGGGMHGAEISLDWARQAAARLEPGGVLLLYTGSAIVGGEDRFKAAVLKVLNGFDVRYDEIDPDVFGEELEREDHADVERIAVVGLVAVKR